MNGLSRNNSNRYENNCTITVQEVEGESSAHKALLEARKRFLESYVEETGAVTIENDKLVYVRHYLYLTTPEHCRHSPPPRADEGRFALSPAIPPLQQAVGPPLSSNTQHHPELAHSPSPRGGAGGRGLLGHADDRGLLAGRSLSLPLSLR